PARQLARIVTGGQQQGAARQTQLRGAQEELARHGDVALLDLALATRDQTVARLAVRGRQDGRARQGRRLSLRRLGKDRLGRWWRRRWLWRGLHDQDRPRLRQQRTVLGDQADVELGATRNARGHAHLQGRERMDRDRPRAGRRHVSFGERYRGRQTAHAQGAVL